MRYRLGLTALVSLTALSTAALADPTDGPYLTGAVGGGLISDEDCCIKPIGTGGKEGGTPMDIGPAGSIAAGYGWGNGLRTEFQIGAAYNTGDRFANAPTNRGYALQYMGLGNAIYDFEVVPNQLWLHVGGGVGIDLERIGGDDHPGFIPPDQHGSPFLYQLMGGAETQVMPNVKLGVEYRFLGTEQIAYTYPTAAAHYDFENSQVMLTLRYDFGPPPPAPPPPAAPPEAAPPAPPAPQPEAQRSFQVFFDFDKSDITSAAARVIQAAADSVKAGNLTRITVTGHTDTVGTVRYNQALSERRASAVKVALVSDGVDGGEITTIGVGKTGLLVPTGDGVREPQNRRAEIVLQ